MLNRILNLFKKSTAEKKESQHKQIKRKSEKKPISQKQSTNLKTTTKANIQKQSTQKKETRWSPKDYIVEEQEGKVRFYDLHLSNGILHAIADLNFQYCTPIQAGILPHTLKNKDAIGRAQTGTGKTAAFGITAITRIIKSNPNIKRSKGSPRVLIIAPTRELVLQIEKDTLQLSKYHNLRIVSVFGGMDYKKQINQVKGKYIDIMIATPGRLLDFMKQKLIRLNKVELFVLDEADRMLDMGFLPDIRKIERSTPRKENRQTLLFSATIPDSIKRITQQWTKDAEVVEIEPEKLEADNISQINYIVSSDEKFRLLFNLIKQKGATKILLFCNRKDTAKDLQRKLSDRSVSSTLLSGNIDQKKRLNRLEKFKNGFVQVLVATDVAGRGIHIENVTHVINYNLPEDAEDYVHRIGRTGRAGAVGTSISFACEDDSFQIPKIEEYIGHKMELIYPDSDLLKELPAITFKPKKEQEQVKKKGSGKKKRYNPSHKKPSKSNDNLRG
ncbi:MAG: DEAD/DEAH box helicase [Bacteroidota bacterium]